MKLALIVTLLGPSAAQAAAPSGNAKVQADLLADGTAIVPGGRVELAVRFRIEEGWHIYWRNSGEGGLEPTFIWDSPPGFTVAPLRYPPPRRYVDQAEAQTYILESEPVVLTTLTAPSDASPGETVTVGVQVRWLVCKEMCIPGEQSLSLELPVVAEASEVKPANAELLAAARAALPVPADRARYLDRLRAVADVNRVKPGASFKVGVVLEVQADHHLNSHQPLSTWLIPTDVFPERTSGLQIDQPVFPPGKVEGEGEEKLSVYRGRTVIVLPVRAEGDLSGTAVRIGGVVTYQACSDKGTCYPPMAAEWSLTLPVAGPNETVAAANPDIFAAPPKGGEGPTETTVAVAETGDAPAGLSWLQRAQRSLAGLGLLGYLVMALIGGFILNLMPCVLPVISIKILSFVQQAKESRLRVFTLGSVFSAGILVSFLVLGGLIVGAGQQWGGLFQSPAFTIGMAAVVLAFALSLFGVFTIYPPRAVNELGEKVQQEGHLSAFGMGLLATLLGTACTAPFLSFVISIAIQQTAIVGMLIFATAGVGMAFPYVLLAAQPAWLKLVPRPGAWMGTFERIVGFLLLATVIWLLNPLVAQIGGDGLIWTLVFLLLVAVAAWLYGKVQFDAPPARKWTYRGAALATVVGGWLFCFGAAPAEGERIAWVSYTRERALAAVQSGKTVFIDYTADWCASCKFNERVVIDTPEVRSALEELGVVPFKADFTKFDPEIKADLDRHGRSGVPMYVIIPADRPEEPIVLDEVLTKAMVVENLKRAGPSRVTESAEGAPAETAEATPNETPEGASAGTAVGDAAEPGDAGAASVRAEASAK